MDITLTIDGRKVSLSDDRSAGAKALEALKELAREAGAYAIGVPSIVDGELTVQTVYVR